MVISVMLAASNVTSPCAAMLIRKWKHAIVTYIGKIIKANNSSHVTDKSKLTPNSKLLTFVVGS